MTAPGGGEDTSSAPVSAVPTSAHYTDQMINDAKLGLDSYVRLGTSRAGAYASMLGRSDFKLLEVGSGPGLLSEGIEAAGGTYWGIDLDPRVVEMGKRLGVAVDHLDMMECELSEGFDVILASQVLEHASSPSAFLSHARSLLKAGGILHVDVPNHVSLAGTPSRLSPAFRGTRLGGLEPPHHLRSFSRRSLQVALQGWSDVEVFETNSSDPVWGQATQTSPIHEIYYKIARLVHRETLVVGLARKS